MNKFLRFFLCLAAVAACLMVLPLCARLPGFEVIRRNLADSVDATPYFYTDVENFGRFEQALKR